MNMTSFFSHFKNTFAFISNINVTSAIADVPKKSNRFVAHIWNIILLFSPCVLLMDFDCICHDTITYRFDSFSTIQTVPIRYHSHTFCEYSYFQLSKTRDAKQKQIFFFDPIYAAQSVSQTAIYVNELLFFVTKYVLVSSMWLDCAGHGINIRHFARWW